jgi:hypothetical protein
LRQVQEIGEHYGIEDLPILCAGDIFDKWNSPPELINFAMKHLPRPMYAIPGQHDLPYHDWGNVHKSAYWTLVESGTIVDVTGTTEEVSEFDVKGFSWGDHISPPSGKNVKGILNVALIHQYVWKKGASYPNAPKENHLNRMVKQAKGWDVVIIGDNHQHWIDDNKDQPIFWNCGGFMRRKSDEKHYRPRVGLILQSGKMMSVELDISQDKFDAHSEEPAMNVPGLEEFLDELSELQTHTLDFVETMAHTMDMKRTSPEVRRIVTEAMEEKER